MRFHARIDNAIHQPLLTRDSPQVLLNENNHMVEKISTERSNQSFNIWILPRRARCTNNLLAPQVGDSPLEVLAENAVPRLFGAV